VKTGSNDLSAALTALLMVGKKRSSTFFLIARSLPKPLHPIENLTLVRAREGGEVNRIQDLWKFTHIRALKTELKPQATRELQF
jgi:hypothetical protein